MKSFLKSVMAVFVGLFLFTIASTVVCVVMLAGLVAQGSSTTTVEDNSVLVLKLSNVTERGNSNPMDAMSNLMNGRKGQGLDDIKEAIRKAAENDKIKGIYLEADASGMGFATAQAIRDALVQFKESKKFILSYGDNYSTIDYFLASTADKVLLNPEGNLTWNGIARTPMFYKDALDKLGVHFQIFKVGTFKSAVEPYMLSEMSEPNREQIVSYLNSIWNHMNQQVAKSRHIPADSLDAYANRGLAFGSATDQLQMKLVDKLAYTEEIGTMLKQLMKLDEDDDYHTLTVGDMLTVQNVPNKYRDGEIAVYYLSGDIETGGNNPSNGEVIDCKKVCPDLRKLRDDDHVKAVVLRVNSPGGSAYDSEQMWKDIVALKEKKPVVVSMGDFAASGGYYVSCAANYIFAEPSTLTGSIGVFGMIPEISELLNDKIGVHVQAVGTHKFSDMMNITRPMNSEEKMLMQKQINQTYDLFTRRCADGRQMQIDDLKAIAEGRVWTGMQAIENGLVDELGGLEKAIAKAKKLAKVEDCSTGYYPAPAEFWERFVNSVNSGSYLNSTLQSELGDYFGVLRTAWNLQKSRDFVQARLPYILQ